MLELIPQKVKLIQCYFPKILRQTVFTSTRMGHRIKGYLPILQVAKYLTTVEHILS